MPGVDPDRSLPIGDQACRPAYRRQAAGLEEFACKANRIPTLSGWVRESDQFISCCRYNGPYCRRDHSSDRRKGAPTPQCAGEIDHGRYTPMPCQGQSFVHLPPRSSTSAHRRDEKHIDTGGHTTDVTGNPRNGDRTERADGSGDRFRSTVAQAEDLGATLAQRSQKARNTLRPDWIFHLIFQPGTRESNPRPRPSSAPDSINVRNPPASLLARPPQQRRRPTPWATLVVAKPTGVRVAGSDAPSAYRRRRRL